MTPAYERILLDTHALLWWAADAPTLSRRVKRLIEGEQVAVMVSAATAWEVATKVRIGKLTWPSDLSVESYCVSQGFELLPITVAHAERAGSWPQNHGDPFDRMLAAQSEREHLPIATNDPNIALFGVTTVW